VKKRYKWAKKIGHEHTVFKGEPRTLCGKSMNGVNYYGRGNYQNKKPCVVCECILDRLSPAGTQAMLEEAIVRSWYRELDSGTQTGNSGVHTFDKYGFTGMFAGLDGHMSASQMRDALKEIR